MRNLIKGLMLLFCLSVGTAQAMQETDKLVTRKGDLDEILNDHQLRVLVVNDNADFYFNEGQPDGLNVSLIREFERRLDERYLADQPVKLNVTFIPVRHDQLLTQLNAGKGDLVLANLRPNDADRRKVDFSIPNMTGLREWLVSSDSLPPVHKLTELSGKHIWVRKSSSYYQSLVTLNDMLASMQLPPVYIEQADEVLQDKDLLAMVQKGTIPYTLIDSHKVQMWGKVLDGLRINYQLPLREDADAAWAFRKNSPRLQAAINDFLSEYRQGGAKGEAIYRSYLDQDQQLARHYEQDNSSQLGWADSDYRRYAPVFQRYARQYRLDWIMILAQAYQESTMNQAARSNKGAMGIMQVLPSTAREPYINVGNINSLENNVHAGIKYMRYMMDNYFNGAELDENNRALFTLAAYNAGPNRIAELRKEAVRHGLNGNIWFGNVEKIAAARVGQETVQYVKNVSSRYVAYRRTYELDQQRKQLRPN